MTTSRDIERVYDLKKLFDRQLDKIDSKLDMPERIAKAAKLLDKVLGTNAWRAETQLPEVEFVQVEVLPDTAPLSKEEVKSLYSKVKRLMSDEGLSTADEGSYVEAREQQASVEPKESDGDCDCYDCTPCDCPRCQPPPPCDCDYCKKQTLLGKFFEYVSGQ